MIFTIFEALIIMGFILVCSFGMAYAMLRKQPNR